MYCFLVTLLQKNIQRSSDFNFDLVRFFPLEILSNSGHTVLAIFLKGGCFRQVGSPFYPSS